MKSNQFTLKRNGSVRDNRIHVFFFHHNFAPAILDIIRFTDSGLFRFTVCNFWGDITNKDALIENGAQVLSLNARRFMDPVAWFKLIRILKKSSPDIIHTILTEFSVPIRFISKCLLKSRIIQTFQNPLSSDPRIWMYLNILTMRMSDAVTGVSNGVVKEIIEKAPSCIGKIRVTQNGVNETDLSSSLKAQTTSVREEFRIGNNETILTCVGRLNFQKGQDFLIKAIKILALKNMNIRLLLVGPDEWDGYLQGLVSAMQLENHVIFLGPRSDIARILRDTDIYVTSSRWEGLPFALMEAMLFRKPCIATNILGHSEILKPNETAISIPANSIQDIADAIKWTLDHHQESENMAKRAQQLIKEKFTAQKMAYRYEQLYLDLIQGHRIN
jgi:glycosyltransferase involved in cell wall biosynthesis